MKVEREWSAHDEELRDQETDAIAEVAESCDVAEVADFLGRAISWTARGGGHVFARAVIAWANRRCLVSPIAAGPLSAYLLAALELDDPRSWN